MVVSISLAKMPSLVLSTTPLRPPPTSATKINPLSSLACTNYHYKPNFLSWRTTHLQQIFTTTTINSSRNFNIITRSYKAKDSDFVDESIPQNQEENTASRYGLVAEKMPKHVSMVVDGYRGDLHPEISYYACRRVLKDIAWLSCELGIKVLSIYSSPSSKHTQTKEEVEFTMRMIESCIKSDLEELARKGIRISIIGNRSSIPNTVNEIIKLAEDSTKENKALHIIGAVDYSGRSDITQACKALMEQVEDGVIDPDDIDENLFQQHLQTKCSQYSDPDLMIRTSGTYQLGNFMLWQTAYSEFYFVDKHAIDFTKADFIEALAKYQRRHRRFGGHKYKQQP